MSSVRAPKPRPTAAEIPTPRGFGYRPPGVEESIPWTWQEIRGYILWGVTGLVIAVFECLAAFGKSTPWPTISSTAGNLERHHPWVAIVILAGIVTLTARIVFYPWPNQPRR